ncbi:Crp/Fnr family transcriptional regulator [Sphingomonas sp.]|jgi:CRP-like cAMP-binding protein|uniref:Crp/Fnr family transcriptional regulator n=1 Tax=Sphingomonas sp. TaxID=28214 RepID=UPI002ED80449
MPASQSSDCEPRPVPASRRNLLLASLRPGDARLIEPHLSRVSYAPGDIVASLDRPLDNAFFPETAIISFRDAGPASRPEIGMVGHEGMIGWPLLLGCESSPLMCVARTSGTARVIRKAPLLEACHISATLHAALLRYVHNFMLQMACTIASSADTIERRVARWVLMLDDRHEGEAMALTHDQIASALHVRRASVTDCLHLLEGDGVLKCVRGRIVVRDRHALQVIAGAPYGVPEAHYAMEIVRR